MEKLTNEQIRLLVTDTYCLDRVDRMTIDLLKNYAFVLHENIKDLTDEEIEIARDFADKYNKSNYNWSSYNSEFTSFVNARVYEACSNRNYEVLESELYNRVKNINDLVGIEEWNFDIFYDEEDLSGLYLVNVKSYNDNNPKAKIRYCIKEDTLLKYDRDIDSSMVKIGNIKSMPVEYIALKSGNYFNIYDKSKVPFFEELEKVNRSIKKDDKEYIIYQAPNWDVAQKVDSFMDMNGLGLELDEYEMNEISI